MTPQGIKSFEQIIGSLGKGFYSQAVSMRFASYGHEGAQSPTGKSVTESIYEYPNAQILLRGKMTLDVVLREGKFRLAVFRISEGKDTSTSGLKLLSLSIEEMDEALSHGKIQIGCEVFVFRNIRKAKKAVQKLLC